MEYLKSKTVKELKSIAQDMGMPFTNRVLKADLISAIEENIEKAHAVALDMNAAKSVETFEIDGMTFTGLNAKLMQNHMEMIRRYNPSLKRDKDGFIILTPAQRRRIHKKDRSFGKKIGFFKEAATA